MFIQKYGRLRRIQVTLVAALLLACGDETKSPSGTVQLNPTDASTQSQDAVSQDTNVDSTLPELLDAGVRSVEATLRVINPATGQGFSGVTVSSPLGDSMTDASGRATVPVSSGHYQVEMTVAGARTHRVWGAAGDANFEQITYLSPDMITGFVYGALGLSDDINRGILVVGLDTPSLAPAVGASAALDVEHAAPFTFAGTRPSSGDTILEGGQGFVTFPNVTPGQVNITVSYPDGACRAFPAETDLNTVEVRAGEVSVIAYTCRQ